MIYELPKDLFYPALLLDLDALDQNCRRIAEKANGKTIRIATKSIRSVPVLKRILHSSPVFKGVMCYSPDEAIFLSNQGIEDILIGYPSWDPIALTKIADMNREGYQITCMVDSIEQVKHLDDIAIKANGFFYLCMDVDMSTKFGNLHFGVRRSPLKSEEAVLQLVGQINEYPTLKIHGIMGYEAQIAGVCDHLPSQKLKNIAISFMKKKSINKIKQRRERVVRSLKSEGIQLAFVNGGGTGSLDTTASEECVTELTAGSGFYAPLLFDYYRDFRFTPSLFFALPIVRKPTPSIYTCLGGGYVSSGAHGSDKVPRPIYPPGGKLLPFEGAGEVQTPVHYDKGNMEIGDAIIFRAAKAGEICERFNEMICFANQQVVDQFLTYRGEGKCFL